MEVSFDEHALLRMDERGATRDEVVTTILHGAQTSARHGRSEFQYVFHKPVVWQEKHYSHKQISVLAIATEMNHWLVITVIVRYA